MRLLEAGCADQDLKPDESDVKAGHISMDSPVARALMGRREGDEVTVRRPAGEVTYTIVGVRYPAP